MKLSHHPAEEYLNGIRIERKKRAELVKTVNTDLRIIYQNITKDAPTGRIIEQKILSRFLKKDSTISMNVLQIVLMLVEYEVPTSTTMLIA